MPFDLDVTDRPRHELERHEPDDQLSVPLALDPESTRLARLLAVRLGLSPAGVVRVALLALARPGGR